MASGDRSTQNGIYHLRVKGRLDGRWLGWFEGFAMSWRGEDETLLSGSVPDQAALYGILGKIQSLGLPLLFVAHTECPCSSTRCPRRGRCVECLEYESGRGRRPCCFREKGKWEKRCAEFTNRSKLVG